MCILLIAELGVHENFSFPQDCLQVAALSGDPGDICLFVVFPPCLHTLRTITPPTLLKTRAPASAECPSPRTPGRRALDGDNNKLRPKSVSWVSGISSSLFFPPLYFVGSFP